MPQSTAMKRPATSRIRIKPFSDVRESTQEGSPDDAAGEIFREIEGAKRCPKCVEPFWVSEGARNQPCRNPLSTLKILVSAAGLEPATHALKGHCSTN